MNKDAILRSRELIKQVAELEIPWNGIAAIAELRLLQYEARQIQGLWHVVDAGGSA